MQVVYVTWRQKLIGDGLHGFLHRVVIGYPTFRRKLLPSSSGRLICHTGRKFSTRYNRKEGAQVGVVVSGTALQAGRSRV